MRADADKNAAIVRRLPNGTPVEVLGVSGDWGHIRLKDGTEGAIENVLTLCSIASKAWYEGASQDEIETNPATTGPYTVTGVETASSITMTARADYSAMVDNSFAEKAMEALA